MVTSDRSAEEFVARIHVFAQSRLCSFPAQRALSEAVRDALWHCAPSRLSAGPVAAVGDNES